MSVPEGDLSWVPTMDLWAPPGQTSQEWDSGISAEATTAQNFLGSGPGAGRLHLEGRENQVGQCYSETWQGPLEYSLEWQCGSYCLTPYPSRREEGGETERGMRRNGGCSTESLSGPGLWGQVCSGAGETSITSHKGNTEAKLSLGGRSQGRHSVQQVHTEQVGTNRSLNPEVDAKGLESWRTLPRSLRKGRTGEAVLLHTLLSEDCQWGFGCF